MNLKYIIFSAILFLAGLGLLFLDATPKSNELTPQQLLTAMNDPSRFISVDDVSDRIIKGDPTLMLFDLRSKEQFDAFTLPGSINIPPDSIQGDYFKALLTTEGKEFVLYSNGDDISTKAWIYLKRFSYKNVLIMRGGLNEWFNTIIKAEAPLPTEPVEMQDLYSFRMAAKQYFTGGSEVSIPANSVKSDKTVKKVVLKPAKPKSSGSAGGC